MHPRYPALAHAMHTGARRFHRRRTGADAGTLYTPAGALNDGGYCPPMAHIGPAVRSRYAGPYPFEGLEQCHPYGDNAECRDYILPVDSTDPVPAGTSARIEAEPQVPFVPRDPIISSDFSSAFLIDDIVVGKNSQFIVPGSIAATTLSEVAVRSRIAFDPLYPGKKFVVRVTNVSDEDQRFLMTLIGNAVE